MKVIAVNFTADIFADGTICLVLVMVRYKSSSNWSCTMHQNSLPLMRANKAILKEIITDSVYGIKFIFTQKENIVATNIFEEKIKFTSCTIITHWKQMSLY